MIECFYKLNAAHVRDKGSLQVVVVVLVLLVMIMVIDMFVLKQLLQNISTTMNTEYSDYCLFLTSPPHRLPENIGLADRDHSKQVRPPRLCVGSSAAFTIHPSLPRITHV